MIETPRLIIKPFTEKDARDFFDLSNDEGFTLFPITIYKQSSVESASEWIKNITGKYGVWEKETNSLIGIGGLTPWTFEGRDLTDITYRLRTSAWGKGFGIELATALVNYGTEVLKLNNITATITPDNHPSKKIASKLGFKFVKHITLKGVPTDLYEL